MNNSAQNDKYVFNFNFDEYLDIETYKQRGGFSALESALKEEQDNVIKKIKQSGLKGRGGAAFPSGIKLEMVNRAEGAEKYIICNADEGEPGTFKDRFIMTHIPYQLLEGITIAAYAAGAEKGFLYIRHEYPKPRKRMEQAIKELEEAGYLGKNILGSNFSLELQIFSGAGSYLCGEETALLASIEGKKGRPQIKPPFPTQSGYKGFPTLIHNVETLTNIPKIIEKGPEWYTSLGTDDSHGTKLISLSGDVKNRGLYEVPFGTSFHEIIYEYGGGPLEGHTVKAVNIGGASGVLVPPDRLHVSLEYGTCAEEEITIGSGAVFVLDERRDILDNVHNRVRFFLHESCGKCTPCREGLRQANILLERFRNAEASYNDLEKLERYTRVMQDASFCGLGQAAGNSLKTSFHYYRDEYISKIRNEEPAEVIA
ncbi:MAG: NADH-ubiquinone oxidoreductase-F iron-sulfur binding region domain-containing protein [Spirochaetales bacterium]|nr:NADH-ubiquinone oxidoreductase-F iron-sulfur binding region domain-containing protein [Spirochaetales bacterium]